MTDIFIKNLGLSFEGKKTFEQLNLKIEKGEFISILGPSGCGKSSLLNILAGSLKADTGEVLVGDTVISGFNEHFAYMPQEDLLLDWKNVEDNITLYQRLHKQVINQDKLSEYIKKFGLHEVRHQYPEILSGGMKQRVALLRTVFVDRDILLLDEPFGALDVFTRQHLQDWLKNLTNILNKIIILVTHDIDEALYLSDRVIIMGGSPASFIEEIDLSTTKRSRQWLSEQGQTRQHIYELLSQKIRH